MVNVVFKVVSTNANLSCHNAEKNCEDTEEEGAWAQFQASHEVDDQKEKYRQDEVKWKITCGPSYKVCT